MKPQLSQYCTPTPSTGLITITGKGLKKAEVVNTPGQRVASFTGKGETLQIDITNQPASIYFINITNEERHKCVCKVMKE